MGEKGHPQGRECSQDAGAQILAWYFYLFSKWIYFSFNWRTSSSLSSTNK
jgi:hypothetical protein